MEEPMDQGIDGNKENVTAPVINAKEIITLEGLKNFLVEKNSLNIFLFFCFSFVGY